MPDDVSNWNADIEAWGLIGEQRTHYFRRLHAYHSALMDRAVARYRRAQVAEGIFALLAFVAVVVLLVVAR